MARRILWLSPPERLADERTEKEALDDETEHERPGQGEDEGGRHGQFRPRHEGEEQEGPHRQKLAVGEIEDARRLVDHHETHGGEAVEKPDADAVHQKLNKEIHGSFPFLRRDHPDAGLQRADLSVAVTDLSPDIQG